MPEPLSLALVEDVNQHSDDAINNADPNRPPEIELGSFRKEFGSFGDDASCHGSGQEGHRQPTCNLSLTDILSLSLHPTIMVVSPNQETRRNLNQKNWREAAADRFEVSLKKVGDMPRIPTRRQVLTFHS